MPYTIADKFSSIASDPLRGFRFYATFVATEDADQAKPTFDSRIRSATSGMNGYGKQSPTSSLTNGKSNAFIGGFTQIGGLQVQVQEIAYREGGYNTTAHKLPGMVTFSPVVFQRGVLYGNDQAMTWLKGLIQVASGNGINGNATGPNTGNFRVDVHIFAVDHPNTSETMVPRIEWKLRNAWITSLTYTDLNSVNNEIMFETMTLTHEGLEVNYMKPTDDGKSFITVE